MGAILLFLQHIFKKQTSYRLKSFTGEDQYGQQSCLSLLLVENCFFVVGCLVFLLQDIPL